MNTTDNDNKFNDIVDNIVDIIESIMQGNEDDKDNSVVSSPVDLPEASQTFLQTPPQAPLQTPPQAKTMTVDRIEGQIAVIERGLGDLIEVPLADLPGGTKEGTVLSYDGISWEIDKAQEQDRRQLIANLKASLFKRSPQS